MEFSARKKINTMSIVTLACLILASCTSIIEDDKQKSSSWKAPERFSTSSVYNASFKALSKGNLEIVSHDREAGIISVKKVFPIPLITIPSQVPVTVRVTKIGKHVMLDTTAFLKGIGTGRVYENIIKDFYDELFLELKINNAEEKSVTKT